MNLEQIYKEVLDKQLLPWDIIDNFNNYKTIIKRPRKPTLKNRNDLKEVEEYIVLLKKYEEDLKEYNKQYEKYSNFNNEIESLKERYIREESGLNSIPEKYRSKVYRYAYEQGHSSGYSEVLNYLYDLVEIFKD